MRFCFAFLCFSLSIKSTLFAQVLLCSQALNPAYSASRPRSFDTLVDKMENLGINLVLNESIDMYDGSPGGDYFEIFAYDRMGHKVAEISMEPLQQSLVVSAEERSVYTSHISIYADSGDGESSMRGGGLGTYLYAAAAWSIHNLGGVLVSSTGPSSQAIEAWERMVHSGWATSGRGRGLGVQELSSSLDLSVSYHFNQRLLKNGFFDDFEELIEDEDMVFIREH